MLTEEEIRRKVLGNFNKNRSKVLFIECSRSDYYKYEDKYKSYYTQPNTGDDYKAYRELVSDKENFITIGLNGLGIIFYIEDEL